jgi:hypothetical protein
LTCLLADLVAYFTQDSLDYLRSIDDIPRLASLPVPPGKYKSARSAKGRPRDQQAILESIDLYPAYPPKSQYASYMHHSHFGPLDHPHSPTWTDYHNDNSPKSRLMSPVTPEVLAPLAYLQNIPPLRRHPLDEKALMSFTPTIT